MIGTQANPVPKPYRRLILPAPTWLRARPPEPDWRRGRVIAEESGPRLTRRPTASFRRLIVSSRADETLLLPHPVLLNPLADLGDVAKAVVKGLRLRIAEVIGHGDGRR